MPIRVYTKHLDLLYEIDDYSSLQLERNYHDVGDLEIHLNEHVHGNIDKDYIVTLGDSAHKAGVILSKEIELDESGKASEEWTYRGPTLQGLLNTKISVPPEGKSHDRKSGPAETVMKNLVKHNFTDPIDGDRAIDRLVIAPDRGRGKHVSHESRYKTVSAELADISKESGLGWTVYIDFTRRKFVFDVVEGLDLTQGNEDGNTPVFFSPDFGTIKSQSFSDSDLEMANVAYVGGPGEGADRKIVIVGNAKGMNRREIFVDARDIGSESEDEEEEMTDEEIEEAMIKRGKEKLAEQANELSLDAEIISPTTRTAYEWQHDGYLQPVQPYGHYERKEQQVTAFVYEKDFDLGDTVPVYNRQWGVTMNARITKMKEIHEPGGFRLEATWGKERPTLVSKIRDKFDELEGIEKQEIPAQLITRHGKDFDKKLTKEQQERIEQAKKNLEEARKRAEDYTDNHAEKKIHVGPDEPDDKNKKWLDTSGSHDKWRRYNHDSNETDDLNTRWPTTDVIDKDTTFAERWLLAKHIESLNGLTAAGGQFQITENGDLKTSGDITGSYGTFDDVEVREGDFKLKDNETGFSYTSTPKRNLIQDHSFEVFPVERYDNGSIKVDENGLAKPGNFGNYYAWETGGTPLIAISDYMNQDSNYPPRYGNRAIVVKDANYVRQFMRWGVSAGEYYTISASFKKQLGKKAGKPRFEIWHVDDAREKKEKIVNKEFDRVSDDYTSVRNGLTFRVPDDFKQGDGLQLNISGAQEDDGWIQCDGVQVVKGRIASVYQPEDAVWDIVNGEYPVLNRHTRLWSGVTGLGENDVVKPSKLLSECMNGWVMQFQRYISGEGTEASNYQYEFIPKLAGLVNNGRGHRLRLLQGTSNNIVYKYAYFQNHKISGSAPNTNKENKRLALTAIYEW